VKNAFLIPATRYLQSTAVPGAGKESPASLPALVLAMFNDKAPVNLRGAHGVAESREKIGDHPRIT